MKQRMNDSVSCIEKKQIRKHTGFLQHGSAFLSQANALPPTPAPDGISVAPFKQPLHSLCIINGGPVSCLC